MQHPVVAVAVLVVFAQMFLDRLLGVVHPPKLL
jgi:hypothetical protein